MNNLTTGRQLKLTDRQFASKGIDLQNLKENNTICKNNEINPILLNLNIPFPRFLEIPDRRNSVAYSVRKAT